MDVEKAPLGAFSIFPSLTGNYSSTAVPATRSLLPVRL